VDLQRCCSPTAWLASVSRSTRCSSHHRLPPCHWALRRPAGRTFLLPHGDCPGRSPHSTRHPLLARWLDHLVRKTSPSTTMMMKKERICRLPFLLQFIPFFIIFVCLLYSVRQVTVFLLINGPPQALYGENK
jgi:hypothetical protein